MDADLIDFAKDLIASFGEDRFYHALVRYGAIHEAKNIYMALGGNDSNWTRLCTQLQLRRSVENINPKTDTRELLCRTAWTFSSHYKEYALKSPTLPMHIHARMMLDQQNEWTKRYAEGLSS